MSLPVRAERLGARTAPNRIVFGAHFTRYVDPGPTVGEPGFYGERLARYLASRAAGGVGTVIAGQAAVHPSTAYQMTHNANVWDAGCIPGLGLVAAAVQEHGALALVQLSHNGGVVPGGWSKLPALAPSPIAQYQEPPQAARPCRDRRARRGVRRRRPPTAPRRASTASRSTPPTGTSSTSSSRRC